MITTSSIELSLTTKRSNTWYLLPILLGIIGGIIAYFILRKSDSSKARNCLLIGIVMVIIFIVISVISFSIIIDEQREKWAAEREADEARALQKRVVEIIKEADLDRQAELSNQEELRIEQMKLDTEEEILTFIQNYKGKDNSGFTLNEAIIMMLNIMYPDEKILSSPTTTGSFIATPDFRKEVSDRYWRVELEMYNGNLQFDWN